MRTLLLIDPDYGEAHVTEHDLTWISDERLADFGITVKEVRHLFAKGWKLADRTLSEIVESPKPDVIPVAYQRDASGKSVCAPMITSSVIMRRTPNERLRQLHRPSSRQHVPHDRGQCVRGA